MRGLTTSPDARRVARLRRHLMAWYWEGARDFPWRTDPTPWGTLVSETMLQQTQAERVAPAFSAFMLAFPTPTALANAPAADALIQWAGLGYNRRALNLHQAARVIRDDHGGEVPDDLMALLALPGVGPYTARAVLAFAFGADVAPVDVNVARVLSRAAANGPLSRSAAQHMADELVPEGEAGDWAQALMDLGARVCVARQPRCAACPVAPTCAWQAAGGEDPAQQNAMRSRPQARFAGSDRFHRGRLVDALRRGPISADELAEAAELPDAGRIGAITAGLVEDGLAEWAEGELRLPG